MLIVGIPALAGIGRVEVGRLGPVVLATVFLFASHPRVTTLLATHEGFVAVSRPARFHPFRGSTFDTLFGTHAALPFFADAGTLTV